VERDFLSPTGVKKKGGFDDLAFYAEHFDTVEVNSSFLRRPAVADDEGLGGPDARRFRVLTQALSDSPIPRCHQATARSG